MAIEEPPKDKGPVVSVQPLADECLDHEFLTGYFEGRMYNDGERMFLCETERCALTIALQCIERGKSMVIYDPYPGSEIPLALCGTYMHSQLGGLADANERQMLAFPSQGYTTRIHKFHWEQTLNPPQKRSDEWTLYDVRTAKSLAEMTESNGLYYAPTNKGEFDFDFDAAFEEPGVVLVDLRRPQWATSQFSSIEHLHEKLPNTSFIYYAGEWNTAAKRTQNRLGVSPFCVTNKLLASATPSKELADFNSQLALQERIIVSEPSFTVHAVHDERLSDHISELFDMKERLRDRGVAYHLVSAAYSTLVNTPVRPEYWTQAVTPLPNNQYLSVPQAIEKLRTAAQKRETADADLLLNYIQKVNTLQRLLNERHPLQNEALARIHDASHTDEDVRFVVSNMPQEKALMLALDAESYEGGEAPDIQQKNDVSRSMDATYVYLYPPYHTDSVYAFPPSPNVEFIVSSLFKNNIPETIANATSDITATQTTVNINGGDGEEDFALDLSGLDNDVEEYVKEFGLSGSRGDRSADIPEVPKSDDEHDKTPTLSSSDSNEDTGRILVVFKTEDELEPAEYRSNEYVHVYDDHEKTVHRKKAHALSAGQTGEAGDRVLRYDLVADDLYEVLLDDAYELDAVRKSQERLDDWREMLITGMYEHELSASDVQSKLADLGSSIETGTTIKFWCSGHTIGPQDLRDVRYTIELFRPGLTKEFVDYRWQSVCSAIEHIRFTHGEIGRNISRFLTAEQSSNADVEFKEVKSEKMARTISRDVKIQTVYKVRHVD